MHQDRAGRPGNAGSTPALHLTPRDLDLLGLLATWRVLVTEQIVAIYARPLPDESTKALSEAGAKARLRRLVGEGLIDAGGYNGAAVYFATPTAVRWVAPEYRRRVRPAISAIPRWVAAAEVGLIYDREGYVVRSESEMTLEPSHFEVVRRNDRRHLPTHVASTAANDIAVEVALTSCNFLELAALLCALSRRYDGVHFWVPTARMAKVILGDAAAAGYLGFLTSVMILPAHAWLRPSREAAMRGVRARQRLHPSDPWSYGTTW